MTGKAQDNTHKYQGENTNESSFNSQVLIHGK